MQWSPTCHKKNECHIHIQAAQVQPVFILAQILLIFILFLPFPALSSYPNDKRKQKKTALMWYHNKFTMHDSILNCDTLCWLHTPGGECEIGRRIYIVKRKHHNIFFMPWLINQLTETSFICCGIFSTCKDFVEGGKKIKDKALAERKMCGLWQWSFRSWV